MASLNTETRKIRNHAGGKNIIGLFWSVAMERFAVFESLSERVLFLWFEWLRVRWYVEQPKKFDLILNNRATEYTPDALAPDRVDGHLVLYQAKPLDLANAPEFKEQMEQFEPQLAAQGYHHEVFVPEDQPDGLWMNLRMFYGYVVRHAKSPYRVAIVDLLEGRDSWSLRDAVQAVRARQIPVGALYTSMFYRQVEFDAFEEINPTTQLRVARERGEWR